MLQKSTFQPATFSVSPLIEITPQKTSLNYFQELMQNTDLLKAFVIRDLKLRYKQTALGIIWVILQPLLSTFLFTLVFGGIFQAASQSDPDQVPYALFVFSGLVFWNYFSDSINFGANSLLTLGDVIKKIYFPRLISPLASIFVASLNFVINFVLLLLVVFIFFNSNLHWSLLPLLLPLILILILTAAGFAFLFSALNLKYRDVKHALPFFMQLLLFVSPVIYPSSVLPEQISWMAYLNPLTAVINCARYIFFNEPLPNFFNLLISFIAMLFIFGAGLTYFRHTEKYFADIA